MLHCTATPSGVDITPETLLKWHTAPKKTSKGYIYKGLLYKSKKLLPDEYISGKKISKLSGNGWSKIGYSKAFLLNNEIHDFVKFDDDKYISNDEITFGAAEFNPFCKHWVYVGGLTNKRKFKNGRYKYLPFDSRTLTQEKLMIHF